MNLVEQIKNLVFSDGNLGQVSSLVGASEGATKSAVGAAVPALLSALSNLTSSSGGSQKLLSALSKFDGASMGNVANMLTENPNAVQEQGNDQMHSLLGGNVISGIANAVARFAGIGSGSIQKLLGYLMPLILGVITSKFAGKATNAQGLTSLFNEQKASIANAMPSGLSLSDVPGLAAAGSAVKTAVGGVQDATTSAVKWVLPILGLVALALVVWWVVQSTRKPEVPEVAKMTSDLTGNVKSLTDTLGEIKDVASAEAALPKLKELDAKLEGMKAQVDKLPDAGKTKITEQIKTSLAKLGDQFTGALMVPGVAKKLRRALEGIEGKLTSLGGLSPSEFALPSTPAIEVGTEISGKVAAVTEALTSIKDKASSEAALPKLKDLSGQLDDAKDAWNKLPQASQTTIGSTIKAALAKLKELVGKVLAVSGVSDKVKPVVNAIMTKLAVFSA